MSIDEAKRFASRALRSFAWPPYAPFLWMLAIEAVFLGLAFNLGAPWGMGTAGALAATLAGDGARHYPGFFLVLPVVYSYLDAAVYTLLGAALIPLAISRILASERSGARGVTGRVGGAVLPTFLTFVIVLGVLFLWEMAVPRVIAPVVRLLLIRGGFLAPFLTWLIGVLVGLVFSTLALYVPIVAMREGGGLSAIPRGVSDGYRLFAPTYLFVVAFSMAPLLIQALLQLKGTSIVDRLRPEIVALLLLAYAILTSLANYFIYAAATRFHASSVKEES